MVGHGAALLAEGGSFLCFQAPCVSIEAEELKASYTIILIHYYTHTLLYSNARCTPQEAPSSASKPRASVFVGYYRQSSVAYVWLSKCASLSVSKCASLSVSKCASLSAPYLQAPQAVALSVWEAKCASSPSVQALQVSRAYVCVTKCVSLSVPAFSPGTPT